MPGRVFGIMHGNQFLPLHDVRVDGNKATYRNGLYQDIGRRRVLSREIKRVTGLQTARWINHLYFRDENNQIVSLKKYLISKYGLRFT